MYHNFYIHSSTEGHLGSFQLLACINRAAMNIVLHVSLLYVGASLGYMSRSGITESSGSTMSNFLRNHQTDFHSACKFLQPTNIWEVFLFLWNLASICCHLSFGSWPIWLPWGGISGLFWFASPWWLRMSSTSSEVSQPFDISQLRTFCLVLYSIFKIGLFDSLVSSFLSSL